ncbi:MAG: hemerythrin family protein [Magnetococcales bacterium]|nr:hemerythrin family protein [Magnetococcales bacterium]
MQTANSVRSEIRLYNSGIQKRSFLWTESLRTGNETIDRQHQGIYESFRGISQLLEMPEVNINYWFSMVIRQTKDYVLTHFSDEERLLMETHYPEFQAHKLMHIEIIETLKRHQAAIKQLKTDEEKIVEARSLLQFFNEWLDTHILVEDTKYVAFMNRTS